MKWSLNLDSFNSLAERERRMVMLGGVVVVLVLIVAVILPLERSVSKAHQRIGKKQADLVWMRSVAPELASSVPPPQVSSGESLIVIIDRSAREAGLGNSLAGSEPSGAGGLNVRLEKAPFDTLIAWLAHLSQQNGIRVESASIDNAGQPGVVNAAVVLHTR